MKFRIVLELSTPAEAASVKQQTRGVIECDPAALDISNFSSSGRRDPAYTYLVLVGRSSSYHSIALPLRP
jgi:hypothetical protein